MKQRHIFGGVGLVVILGTALTFAFWAGVIYFAFWCLQHFGVI